MHVILWRFTIPASARERFLAAYGPAGDWVQLFRRASGYCGTELIESSTESNVFVTIDRWDTAADFDRFQEQFGDTYRALDATLEGLTLTEEKLGVFTSIV